MNRSLALAFALSLLALAAAAAAQDVAVAELEGFQEVPAVFSNGSASFAAEISADETRIDYTMEYGGVRGDVTQSHIHVGQEGVNGGIVVFLCSNLGNGPAGTPTCPTREGEVSGTWTVDDVVAVNGQGFDDNAVALRRVIRALREGVAYVNLHTTRFPGGELRGQVTVEED